MIFHFSILFDHFIDDLSEEKDVVGEIFDQEIFVN
jgi:hypothetical protein